MWLAEGGTVLGKTVEDRERPNGNTTERSVKNVGNSQRPSKIESLRVAEIETSSIPVILKDPFRKQKKRLPEILKTLSDYNTLTKTPQTQRPSATHKDSQRLYRDKA